MTYVLLDRTVSGNCWRVRLLMGCLRLAYRRVEVDILAGEQHDPAFRALSPRGHVPVLLHNDGPSIEPQAIWESTAILTYLAARHGPTWLADTADRRASEQQWLALAGQEQQFAIRGLRGAVRFGLSMSPEARQDNATRGRASLVLLDWRLRQDDFLTGGTPGIADLACYPYARLAPEAGLETGDLPGLLAWFERIEAIPGYTAIDAPPEEPPMAWSSWLPSAPPQM